MTIFTCVSALLCAAAFFAGLRRASVPSDGQHCVDVAHDPWSFRAEVWERPADKLVGSFTSRAEADAFVARIGAPLCAELDFRPAPHEPWGEKR